ncbi:MAG: metallophosphoesterase family protein, partial [Acidobacteria bacterium]|nr:metallophosphoesterase family protein [Acidobacteriota bacterium]
MRYLIISDLHSNLEALQAVSAAAEGEYDEIVCCGDLV